jgi:serine phosphatase RsbU (regulator of sigma subunit)
MVVRSATDSTAFLVPLAGPRLQTLQLMSKQGGMVIGRHEQCDLHLPADAESVSRFHARFHHDGARWHVADLASRWGTTVNGIKLVPHTDVPLDDGDLIRIDPWTFALSRTDHPRGLQPSDDVAQTAIRTLGAEPPPMVETTLTLLLETADAIHAAQDETQLAELVIDVAMRGTGLQNAAMLRPVDHDGRVAIIASRFAPDDKTAASFSRSLMSAAAGGHVAEIAPGHAGEVSQSILQLRISSAICVPLMLGGAPAAYLYLDSRGTLLSARPGSSAFCVALGRMASLALANLKRIEMEKREAEMKADLFAAAAAQKWIMPKRQGSFGPFRTIGESRAGRFIGGDFFDIIPLDQERLAVAVGDVSGKGVEASVLMTATQGYLNAALRDCGDAGVAVTRVNAFVNPRRPENKFVTLWLGVFNAAEGTLCYVDAGHSYALLQRADGSFEQLDKGGGLPVGVMDNAQYNAEMIKIAPGDKVMIVSDGIIEQFGLVNTAAGTSRDQFQMTGLQQALAKAGADEVADLFTAVIHHAGTDHLSDDATAVFVRFQP